MPLKIKEPNNFPDDHELLRFTPAEVGENYKIIYDKRHKVHVLLCRRCGMMSYNPGDVEDKYCNNCNQFLED